MAYHDVLFPEDISYGSAGGPGFNTTVVGLDSGAELRFGRWSTPRRRFDAQYGVKSLDQLATLLDFYTARQGALHSFRYKDFLDFTTAADHRSAHSMTDVLLGTGDGSTTQYQLKKVYPSSAGNQERTITKPGGVLAALDGVTTTAFSVNTTTGIITFGGAPGAGVVIRAGFEFYNHVRFGEDVDEALMLSYEDFSTGGAGSVPMIEVLDEVGHPDEFDYGGATSVVASSSFDIEPAKGRVQVVTTTATGLSARLPGAGELEPGGPHFYVHNAGSNSFTLTSGTTTVKAVAAGETCVVLVYLVGSAQAFVGVIL